MPLGNGSNFSSRSCFSTAHREIAVGPLAPARTAIRGITTRLTRGYRRLICDRGSSSPSKCYTTSSTPIRSISVIIHPPCLIQNTTAQRTVYNMTARPTPHVAGYTCHQHCHKTNSTKQSCTHGAQMLQSETLTPLPLTRRRRVEICPQEGCHLDPQPSHGHPFDHEFQPRKLFQANAAL